MSIGVGDRVKRAKALYAHSTRPEYAGAEPERLGMVVKVEGNPRVADDTLVLVEWDEVRDPMLVGKSARRTMMRGSSLVVVEAAPKAPTTERPTIVCLCGSTRFSAAFREANLRETLAGNIVLSVGCDMRGDDDIFSHLSEEEKTEVKQKLDALHLKKVAMADEVLILNCEGYIGSSTRRELDHAISLGKRVRYLEEVQT